MAHDTVVSDNHVVAKRRPVTDAAVAPDPDRPLNQRTGLDHRAFADKYITPNLRLAKRLAKLLRTKIRPKVTGNSWHHLPRLAKRSKQFRVLCLTRSNSSSALGISVAGSTALGQGETKKPSRRKGFL